MPKFYITTSIPYVNAPPHIGFAQEVVAADVLARFHRQIGDEVFFLTGTDDHGIKIEQAASRAGKSPKEFADEIASQFKDLKTVLNLSNDDFVRTTQSRHIKVAQDIWQRVAQRGDIYKSKYKAYYCVGHEAFMTEKDLINGKCPDHKLAVELVEEENYFFRLSKYSREIESRIKNNELRILPDIRRNEVLAFLKQGVQDISISRPKEKLSWGIPVAQDKSHVMYVWFEALSNYLVPGGNWWPADIHVVGKDISRFHAVIWPAMLMSAELELPKKLLVHGFITVEGQKMSKSLGNVVSPQDLVERFGVDATRFLLLRELPFLSDSDFSWGKAKACYNAELANDLGNLVQRVVVLLKKFPRVSMNFEEFREIRCADADRAYKNLNISGALDAVWTIVVEANQYIDAKKPWTLTGNKIQLVLQSLVNRVLTIASGLEPVTPVTSSKIRGQIQTLKAKPLFPRLS